jgi:hypothetical protein
MPVTTEGPRRVQRQRTKGWRMPENTVYVGRPSRFANPYEVAVFGRSLAVTLYTRTLGGLWTPANIPNDQVDEAYRSHTWLSACLRLYGDGWIQRELRGKNLACWCPPEWHCHVDILLELANA